MASTVRSLFISDVEGSTALVERAGDGYTELLSRYRDVVRKAVRSTGGIEHGTDGDSFFLSFDSPTAALRAAVDTQVHLEAAEWPDGQRVRVRIGLHVGEVVEHDDNLVGLAIHHTARIAAAAHGGQIIVSDRFRGLLDHVPEPMNLMPLGPRRLRDVGTVPLFQVVHPALQVTFPPLRGVITNHTNLPRTPDAFVRGDELLHSIGDAFESAPLVTLTGAGGVGKTRAAVEFGWAMSEDFEDGALLVDLAPIAEPEAVPGAVASVLPMIAQGGSVVDAVVEWLARRTLLLVADNCEHVLGEVCEVVTRVIAGCPDVRILATSREALGVRGERVLRVPSLAPEGDGVALFTDRARAVDATFRPDGHEPAIVAICQRLDGIPLAIELAAARMSSMTPAELLDRLHDRFRILRGSGRGTLDRHQTLRATVTWSYQLLNEHERICFDRLSVFAGSFDLPAAEAVCGFEPLDGPDVLDLVHSLVDKSMVQVEHSYERTRYRVLEPMRQFGEERLEASAEIAGLRDRHLEHVAVAVGQWDRVLRGTRQVEATAWFADDWDNIRAAHAWATSGRRVDDARNIVERCTYYALSQLRHDHCDWAERTIELEEEVGEPTAVTLCTAAFWANLDGDDVRATDLSNRGIAAAPHPDHPSTIRCWVQLAGTSVLREPSDPIVQDSYRHLEAAVANLEDPDFDWWAIDELADGANFADPAAAPAVEARLAEIARRVPAPLLLSRLATERGHLCLRAEPPRFEEALACYEQGLQGAIAAGERQSQGYLLRGAALASTALGRPDAVERCRIALETLYEMGYWQKLWQALDCTAFAFVKAGRFPDAALILGHLEAHMPSYGLEQQLGFRSAAINLLAADGDHEEARQRGAALASAELVERAIAACALEPGPC